MFFRQFYKKKCSEERRCQNELIIMTDGRTDKVISRGRFAQQMSCWRRVLRRNLGIRREMMVTGLQRLTPSRADIEGWPPLVVTLQHPQVQI